MSQNQSSSPVAHQERADILDILRGIALLGILINNVFNFSGNMFMSDAAKQAFPTHAMDKVTMFLQVTFVEGKFYTLFSLLFGIGFSIILLRNEQRSKNPLGIFYRRLFILIIIGLLHSLVLWIGDIVLLYGLIGLVLPLFRKLSNRAILTWAILLILSPILIDIIRIITNWNPGHALEQISVQRAIDLQVPLDAQFPYYPYRPEAGYKEIWNLNQVGIFIRYQYILDTNRIPKVLGIFLLGLYAGRKLIYAKLEENIKLLKQLQRYGFIIGIPFSAALAYFETDAYSVPSSWKGMFDTVTYAIGIVPLSLAYTATICRWYLQHKDSSRLRVFAPVGRMALTNYIVQTICCITLFYGIGFALGNTMGYTYAILTVLPIYVLQIFYSNYWFQYFNYGPLEWIWRQLTYGKRLPLGKKR